MDRRLVFVIEGSKGDEYEVVADPDGPFLPRADQPFEPAPDDEALCGAARIARALEYSEGTHSAPHSAGRGARQALGMPGSGPRPSPGFA